MNASAALEGDYDAAIADYTQVVGKLNTCHAAAFRALKAKEQQAERKDKQIADMKEKIEKNEKKDDKHKEDIKEKDEKINELNNELASWRSKPVQEAAEMVQLRALVATHEQAAQNAATECKKLNKQNATLKNENDVLKAELQEAQDKVDKFDQMKRLMADDTEPANKRHRTTAPAAASAASSVVAADTPETQPGATPARQHAASLLSLGDTTSVGRVVQP
eukprot:COSAG02_NODE_9684_length_2141_cov_19.559745_1_plen_221_part_00